MSDMPNILVVCDLQKDFMPFVEESLFKRLKNLVTKRKWEQVIVIIDTNMGEAMIPEWLGNQSTTILTKKYGYYYGVDDMESMAEFVCQEDETYLEVESNDLYIPVNGVHNWFAVPEEFRTFFRGLEGQDVTLVGGCEDECLQDIHDALEYLGVKPHILDECCYNASFLNKLTDWYEYEVNWVKVY